MGMSRSSVLRIAGLPFQLQSMPWEEERKRTQAYLHRLVMFVRKPSVGPGPQAAQFSNPRSTAVLTNTVQDGQRNCLIKVPMRPFWADAGAA